MNGSVKVLRIAYAVLARSCPLIRVPPISRKESCMNPEMLTRIILYLTAVAGCLAQQGRMTRFRTKSSGLLYALTIPSRVY